MVSNMLILRCAVVSLTPTLQGEDRPFRLSAAAYSVFAVILHSWRPFTSSAPEDAPCCSDKGPTLHETTVYWTDKM
jgi:hypothetical protein